MKKRYIAPAVGVTETQGSSMLCASQEERFGIGNGVETDVEYVERNKGEEIWGGNESDFWIN